MAVTACLSFVAMTLLFGALALWVVASAARGPETGGSATLHLAGAGVCALAGSVLFGLAVQRVRRRLRSDGTDT